MTEISKMFENAGINKSCHANIKFDDCICSPSDCGYYNYPDFTAEKQLKIIKLLSKIRGDIQLCYIANQYIFVVNFETSKCQWANKYHEKIDEALADMVNVLWKSLPDKEKEEIRGILE